MNDQTRVELADLERRLDTLKREQLNIEMSDDRAYTNGRMSAITSDIANVRQRINLIKAADELDV